MIVVWRVTEHCNLSCGFCAYDRRLEIPRRSAEPAEIRRVGETISQWKRVSGEQVLVSWLGGEPLLWKPLEELTAYFTGPLALRVSTTTNGTTLHLPRVRQHLLEHYTELTVSMDARGERHDQLRGQPGLFARVRDGVCALVREKSESGALLKLRANIVLMRDTIGDLAELCRELASWGIQEITFNALGGRDRPEFFPANRLLPEQALRLERCFPVLKEELRLHGVTLSGSAGYLQRIVAGTRDTRVAVSNCHPGETFLFIDERGRISPCSFTAADYGVPTEELHDGRAFAALPQIFRDRREQACAAACEDCMSTHVFAKFASNYGS